MSERHLRDIVVFKCCLCRLKDSSWLLHFLWGPFCLLSFLKKNLQWLLKAHIPAFLSKPAQIVSIQTHLRKKILCFCRIWGRNLITTAGVYSRHREKKIAGDKWIYRANDKTWGGITDRWKDRGCAANRQNAPVQSRAHLWEHEFVLLHFSRVASPVDLQKKKGG